MAESLLEISGIGFPTASLRGATETITHIDQAAIFRRTINGALIPIVDTNFQKYKTSLTCSDQLPPAFNNVWPGKTMLTVKCISEFCYLTSSGTPSRPVVSGSSRVVGSYTFYRPQLTMLLTQFSYDTDEWGCLVNWTMNLEEV